MIAVNEQLIKAVSEAVFQTLLNARKVKTPGLRFEGKTIATSETPAFLQTAVLLRDYFCPVEAWRNNPSIVALVQQAVADVDREIEATDNDFVYLDELRQLREELSDWLG